MTNNKIQQLQTVKLAEKELDNNGLHWDSCSVATIDAETRQVAELRQDTPPVPHTDPPCQCKEVGGPQSDSFSSILTGFTDKIYKFISRVAYDTLERPPVLVGVEVTNRCNSRCVFCPRDKIEIPMGIMSDEVFEGVIGGIREVMGVNRVSMISLSGFGEPLLDGGIFEKIRRIKVEFPGVGVKFFTNGMLLTVDVARRLQEVGLDRIEISFEGWSRARYNSVRVGLDYDVVFSNIVNALEVWRVWGGPDVYMGLVTYPEDMDKRKGFKAYWLRRGVKKVLFHAPHNWNGNLYESKPTRGFICSMPWRFIGFSWRGDITPCCIDINCVLSVGNVRSGAFGVLNGYGYKRFRDEMLRGNGYKNPLCAKCNWPMQKKWLKPCRDIVRKFWGRV